jgi:hypothetical protein
MSQESKNAYLRKQRTERRKFAFDFLGGKCVDCGGTEWLQFDHDDPKTKKFAISKIWSTTWEIFLEELKKCKLRCIPCHKKKSAKEARQRLLGTGKHGTMWMYYKHKCRCEECRAYKHKQYLKYG